MIEYKSYTKKDLRTWIVEGDNNGLCEAIISHVRAWSLLHCPDAKDDDIMVVAAIDPIALSPIASSPKIIGFTAVFPEKLIRPDVWIATGTTLWVEPEYAGEFVGYELVKRLWEAYPHCVMLGSDVAQPAAMIDKLLGAKIEKMERRRYVLRRKIEVHSLRNLGSLILEPYRLYRQKQHIKRLLKPMDGVRVAYSRCVDAEAYQFILSHSDDDQMVRSQQILNWWLNYPFTVDAPLEDSWIAQPKFSCYTGDNHRYLTKVYFEDELVGLFEVKVGQTADLKLLYFEVDYQDVVFHTIARLLWLSGAKEWYSIYSVFNQYMDNLGIALKDYKVPFLWTYAKAFPWNKELHLQGADGDMFV